MILVDLSVGSKDLLDLLPKGYAERTKLEFGDAVVVGNGPTGPCTEAFERKRLKDSLDCLQTGRLAGHQSIGLRDSYDFVWLVIEDEIRKHPETGRLQRVTGRQPLYRRVRGKRVVVGEEIFWSDALFGKSSTITWRDYWHWLLSRLRIDGFDDIAFTRNAQETADLIWTTYTWRQKDWKAHKSHKVFNRAHRMKTTMLFKPPLVAEIAGRYKDVGFDTAIAIADRYASPMEFACATAHDLAQLVVTERKDGAKVRLGKQLAESIVRQTKERRKIK